MRRERAAAQKDQRGKKRMSAQKKTSGDNLTLLLQALEGCLILTGPPKGE